MKSQPIPNPLYPVVVSAGVVLAGAIALEAIYKVNL